MRRVLFSKADQRRYEQDDYFRDEYRNANLNALYDSIDDLMKLTQEDECISPNKLDTRPPDTNIDEVIQAGHPSNFWSNNYNRFEAYVDYEYVDEPRSEDSEEAGVDDEDGTFPTSRRHSIDENQTSSGPAQPTRGEGQLIDLEDHQPQLRQSIVRKTVILDVSRPTTIRLDLELSPNPSLILQVDKTAVCRRVVSAGHPESNASAVQIQSFNFRRRIVV